MKRIIFALLCTTLPSIVFAHSTTALTYAMIRIIQKGMTIAKATCPIVPEATETSQTLFTWSDDAFDTDLEGAWDHKITCDVELSTQKNHNANVTITSIYTLSDFGGSRTIEDETVFVSNLAEDISEEIWHSQTVKGKNETIVEVSFTQNPEKHSLS